MISRQLITQLKEFSTCEIADAMLKLGQRPWGGYIPDLDMWSPEHCSGDMRIAGPAYTVQMVHCDDKTAPVPEQHYVDAAEDGSIIVISVPPEVKGAVWGGLMSARAQAKQIQGVVIDGRVRDLAEQRALKFPVFAKSHSILPQNAFARPSRFQVPLIMSTAPTTVHPGDIIVADLDGVLSIPSQLVSDVLRTCKELTAIDKQCMEALKAGHTVKDTFAKYRGKK